MASVETRARYEKHLLLEELDPGACPLDLGDLGRDDFAGQPPRDDPMVPEPAGAESVRVVERRRGAGYRYTFTTRQAGLLPRTTWDLDAPARLVARGAWFIAVWEERTEAWLKAALSAPRN